jgi:hypothetical protein
LDPKEAIQLKSLSSKEASSTMPVDGRKILKRTAVERVSSQYLQTPFMTLSSLKMQQTKKPKRGRKNMSKVEKVSFTCSYLSQTSMVTLLFF